MEARFFYRKGQPATSYGEFLERNEQKAFRLLPLIMWPAMRQVTCLAQRRALPQGID